ncbi:uncharacterized protein KGF55_005695 [Candida pseudojiufengensis]|uniref:uncharacterized protein n=1 Tax=Candida pseudojiufengensis TaxID=497109 RepID=UPI002224346D|nr:uncharacterized protein KGF55_005695 [Candida pseudojiufengensis]KAI5958697.1 hypothetical protein KGF55_005695 [Candida pseudojiufengensis]
MDNNEAFIEGISDEYYNSVSAILYNDDTDFESDSDEEEDIIEEERDQDMIDLDEEDVPERIDNDDSETTVEELCHGFKYVDGFIVKDGKVYNARGSSFKNIHYHVWNEISEKRLRLVRILKYKEGRIYKIKNNTIFDYVEPVTRFVSQKRGKTSFSKYPSKGAVKVTGATVNFNTRGYVMIVLGKPGEEICNCSTTQDVTPQLEENNTILNTMYGNIEYDDDDIQLVKDANNAEIIKNGEMVYWTLYNKAIKRIHFKDIMTTTKHNGVEKTTQFIKTHRAAYVNSMAHSFGRLLCIVWIAKDLKMIDNEKYTTDLALVNDILDPSDEKKVESITKLVRRFIEKPDSLIAAVFSLFFTPFNESRFYPVSICIKRLNSIRNICKYTMATTRENLVKYEIHKSSESTNVPGTVLTDKLFTSLLKGFTVKGLNDDACVIEGTKISKNDLIDIYKTAKTIFDESWERICLHSFKFVSQSSVYAHYLTYQTSGTSSFLPGRLKTTFPSFLGQNKEKVLHLIQKCTLALMVMIYVSSCNTFRFSELSSLAFQSSTSRARNIVHRNENLHIQTFNKINGERKYALRWYPKIMDEMMVAFLFALRPLQMDLLEGSFEKIRSEDYGDEVDASVCFRQFCFLDDTGRLINLRKFNNFLHAIYPSKRLGSRYIRKAITFMAKRNVTTRVHQDAAEFMEGMSRDTPITASINYPQDLNIVKKYFKHEIPSVESLGKNWCKYLEILPADPPRNFSRFNILEIKEKVLSKYPNFEFTDLQYSSIFELLMGNARSLIITGGTGAGKTDCVLIPMELFKKSTQLNMLHVVVVPNVSLKSDIMKKFGENLNVLDGDRSNEITKNTDVIVCSYELFKEQKFEKWLSRKKSFGFIVLDEAHLIQEETRLKQMRKNIKLFMTSVFLTATPSSTLTGYLEEQFQVNIEEYQGIKDV